LVQQRKVSQCYTLLTDKGRGKKQTNRITSIDAEKALDKIQHSFMIKTLDILGIEGNFLNLIKGIYEKHRANIIMVKD